MEGDGRVYDCCMLGFWVQWGDAYGTYTAGAAQYEHDGWGDAVESGEFLLDAGAWVCGRIGRCPYRYEVTLKDRANFGGVPRVDFALDGDVSVRDVTCAVSGVQGAGVLEDLAGAGELGKWLIWTRVVAMGWERRLKGFLVRRLENDSTFSLYRPSLSCSARLE